MLLRALPRIYQNRHLPPWEVRCEGRRQQYSSFWMTSYSSTQTIDQQQLPLWSILCFRCTARNSWVVTTTARRHLPSDRDWLQPRFRLEQILKKREPGLANVTRRPRHGRHKPFAVCENQAWVPTPDSPRCQCLHQFLADRTDQGSCRKANSQPGHTSILLKDKTQMKRMQQQLVHDHIGGQLEIFAYHVANFKQDDRAAPRPCSAALRSGRDDYNSMQNKTLVHFPYATSTLLLRPAPRVLLYRLGDNGIDA